MVHVNPLTSNNGEAMSWTDAAIIALILTLASTFTVFWPQWSYLLIVAMPGAWAYALIGFVGAEFFTILVALKGIARFAPKKNE